MKRTRLLAALFAALMLTITATSAQPIPCADRWTAFRGELAALWGKQGYVTAAKRKAIVVDYDALIVACGMPPIAPPPTSTYTALTDRIARPAPAPTTLGPAGFAFTDPTFGSRLIRVTDEHTDAHGVHVPSNSLVSAWSADSATFYVMGAGGNVMLFSFDGTTPHQLPIAVPGSNVEPSFSFTDPAVLFIVAGSNLRTLQTLNIKTGATATVLNLDTAYPTLALTDTYVGSMVNADHDAWALAFGGGGQDQHRYIRHSGGGFVDTAAGLAPYRIHGLALDRTGRYVLIFCTGDDIAKGIPQVQVWDTQTNVVRPMHAANNGHGNVGYGVFINQDVSSGPWDAMQWQIRSLTDLEHPTNLLPAVLTPKEVFLDDHSSWRAATAGSSVPFISSTYRYPPAAQPTADFPWRAWDNEIIAVATDGSGTVWRFAHHQSVIDTTTSFWDQPLLNASPDGRFVLFHSNWGQTIGAGRQDVFLVQLKK